MSDPIRLDGEFIVSRLVPIDSRMPWEYIKEGLIHEASLKIIPPMIDSGLYHVIKIEMGSRPSQDSFYRLATEYFIIASLSMAVEQKIRFLPVVDMELSFRDGEKEVKIDRVCLHCGNKLNFNSRGGCMACGAPNGGYK